MIRKENNTSGDHAKIFKPSSSISSKTWSRSNDPRIVRVSRAFGGKDRHSKVFTVKGLRDRRIRLSVPTAVHLYDLQERLGLNQPSKVVAWLLNAAKDDIDELPPLQIPPGSFCHNVHQILSSNSHQDFRSRHEKQAVLTIGGGINWLNHDQLKNPRSNFVWGSSKDAALGETRTNIDQKDENSARLHEEQGSRVSACWNTTILFPFPCFCHGYRIHPEKPNFPGVAVVKFFQFSPVTEQLRKRAKQRRGDSFAVA